MKSVSEPAFKKFDRAHSFSRFLVTLYSDGESEKHCRVEQAWPRYHIQFELQFKQDVTAPHIVWRRILFPPNHITGSHAR